ncbi:MAG: hypothetical protein ACJ8R9_05630 [Steroidobacteraceae bacterium]
MNATDMNEAIFINLADLPDPSDPKDRSRRELNAAKCHRIPLGTLVDLEDGLRLYVVYHGRDCDNTPFYWLSPNAEDINWQPSQFFPSHFLGGFAQENLIVIRLP